MTQGPRALLFDLSIIKLIAYWCLLLITFENSLDTDQAWHFVGPDLDQNCFTHLWWSALNHFQLEFALLTPIGVVTSEPHLECVVYKKCLRNACGIALWIKFPWGRLDLYGYPWQQSSTIQCSPFIRPNKKSLFRVAQPYLNLLVKPWFFFRFSENNIILCILKGKMPFKMLKIIFFSRIKNDWKKYVCLPYLKFSDPLPKTHLLFYLA